MRGKEMHLRVNFRRYSGYTVTLRYRWKDDKGIMHVSCEQNEDFCFVDVSFAWVPFVPLDKVM